MPCRVFCLLPLLGMLSLGGCALSPVDRAPATPSVTPAELDAAMYRAVSPVADQCRSNQQLLTDAAIQHAAMTADIRELGSQLRSLNSQIEALDSRPAEPQPVVSQCQSAVEGMAGKELLGRSEWIGLPTVGTYLDARIASGANTSILSAREITSLERDGKAWVRFKLGLNDTDDTVDSVRDNWIEAPVEREVTINDESGGKVRPVVSLLVTLGPIREQVEFILGDRPSEAFPVMLGRRFLMDIAVVDVSQANLHERPEFKPGK